MKGQVLAHLFAGTASNPQVGNEGGAVPGWYRSISGRCKELGTFIFESWMSVPNSEQVQVSWNLI